jgi:hypothetical protein
MAGEGISRALWTGASIKHRTFTAGSGAVGSNSMRYDCGEANAQMVNIAAIIIIIPRIRKWMKKARPLPWEHGRAEFYV